MVNFQTVQYKLLSMIIVVCGRLTIIIGVSFFLSTYVGCIMGQPVYSVIGIVFVDLLSRTRQLTAMARHYATEHSTAPLNHSNLARFQ